MKKLLIAATIFISSFVNAQQEVSIDLGDALVMKTLELSYEYYLSSQNSLGMSALFNFNGENSDLRYNEETMITPFFRHYFSSSESFNYFGEIFLGVNSGERQDKEYTDAAIGAAIGAKYNLGSGIVITGLAGLGRNLFTSDSYELVPRLGVNVGYKF